MFETVIQSKYGLIGDELELKKNISIDLDENGKIAKLSYDNVEDDISFSERQHNYLLIPGLVNSHVHICDSFAKEVGFNKDLISVVAPPNGIKHKLLESIPKEIKTHGIKEVISDMLASGITLFADFRENGISGINLLKEVLEGFASGRFLTQEDVRKFLDGKIKTIVGNGKVHSSLVKRILTEILYTGYIEYPEWEIP